MENQNNKNEQNKESKQNSESTEKKGKNLVGIAIVWATMMIAVSLIVKDAEKIQALILLMVAGWIATGGFTGTSSAFYKAECRMFRRMIGRGPKTEG